mmetsp:Transcript_946/g.2595  ORF Transcript_946/g.2595 Transcript_946/m.2595 type:complete len:468 (-) Transcript_946:1165-2568(-)
MLAHLEEAITTLPPTAPYASYASEDARGRTTLLGPTQLGTLVYTVAFVDNFETDLGRTALRFSERSSRLLGVGIVFGTPVDAEEFGRLYMHCGDAARVGIEPPQGASTTISRGDVEGLQAWVEEHRHPLVYTLAPGDGPLVFSSEKDVHVLVFEKEGEPYRLTELARAAAARITGDRLQHSVVQVKGAKEDNELFQRVTSHLAIPAEELQLPLVVVVELRFRRFRKGTSFWAVPLPLAQPTVARAMGLKHAVTMNEDTLVEWEEAYLAGRVPNVIQVEDPDAAAAVKALRWMKHVSAENFEDLVIKSDVDVVVALYQEGCEHCGRIDLDLSVEGLMDPTCGACSYQERERLINQWQRYLPSMDTLAGMFRRVPSVEFFALNVVNNTLSDAAYFGMGAGALWAPGFYLFRADDKASPVRAPWPGTYLDIWVTKTVSIPIDESAIGEPPEKDHDNSAETSASAQVGNEL